MKHSEKLTDVEEELYSRVSTWAISHAVACQVHLCAHQKFTETNRMILLSQQNIKFSITMQLDRDVTNA